MRNPRLVRRAVVLLGLLAGPALLGCAGDDPPGATGAAGTLQPATAAPDGTPSTATAASATPVRDVQLSVRGFTFDAWEAGPSDGELVLLLHGFPQSKASWTEVIGPLADAGYHVVAPDQRGYSPGARPAGDEAYVITELVADAVGMADALGAERFHVVGHDWGAAVAWTTAALHPERVVTVAGLSVPHPAAYAASMADPTSGQLEASGYVDLLVRPDAPEALSADGGAGIRALFAASGLEGPAAEAFVADMADPEAVRGAVAWYRANDLRGDLAGALPPVTQPSLFVWSTDDVAIPRATAERGGDAVTGEYTFEVLDGVSHWIPEEAPDRVVELVLAHLMSR